MLRARGLGCLIRGVIEPETLKRFIKPHWIACALRIASVPLFAFSSLAASAPGEPPPTPSPAPVCRQDNPAAAPALETIRTVMASGRFIAYNPTGLQVIDGQLTRVSPASIREDLKILRPRFDGLITYGATHGAERIPDVAAELGFKAVIMGVWDVNEPTAMYNIIKAARRRPEVVMGVSIGNERVFASQVTFEQMTAAIARARKQVPQLAYTTSEPFHMFQRPEAVATLAELDFLLPIVHPVHQPWFRTASPHDSAEFVGNVLTELAKVYCGPILVKETGIPTAPAEGGFSATLQADFYRALAVRVPPDGMHTFAYFSAFDAPWRVKDVMAAAGHYPEEAFWGLFDEQRRAKPVVEGIGLLPQ